MRAANRSKLEIRIPFKVHIPLTRDFLVDKKGRFGLEKGHIIRSFFVLGDTGMPTLIIFMHKVAKVNDQNYFFWSLSSMALTQDVRIFETPVHRDPQMA